MAEQAEHASPAPEQKKTAAPGDAQFQPAPDDARASSSLDGDSVPPPAGLSPRREPQPGAPLDGPSLERGLLQLQSQVGNQQVQRVVARRVAVQRQPAPPAAPAPPSANPPAANRPTGLIVDDTAENLDPGQMKRGQFLAQARAAATLAADQALSENPLGAAVRAQVMQELDRLFGAYSGMDAKGLENSIRAQVPGAAGVSAAASFAPLIAAQVRQNVAANLPKAPSVSSIGEAVGGAVSDMAQAAGSMLSTIGGLLFKAREGGAHADDDPQAVRAQLSGGESLAGGVRSGMSAALGQDFSDVRVHTDARATGMADRFNARAFTVGQDIVFGAGEYQPGSPVGDALIAHELAHVAQQRGSTGGPQSMPLEGAPEDALEADADRVAMSAVTSIWGRTQGDLSRIAQNAVPNLRAGLRLSRCGKDAPAPDVTPAPTTTPAPAAPPKEPPLHDQFTTGPARQGAIDKVFGSSGFDASLLEGGKMFYGGDMGGEGLTYPPLDKKFQTTHQTRPPNKKPFVDIFGGAFAAGWPLLTSTMFHEYQHVKQMHRKPDMLVPGTHSEGAAQETEAYAREIIEAEGKGLDADYIEGTLWRRLNSQGWNKLSKAEKAKLQPLYDKAKAVVDRVTKRAP